MANKVENTKAEVLPSEEVFNDEDIIVDVLNSLKHLGTSYGTLLQEASNKDLSTKLEVLSKEVGTMARDSFNYLFKKGWYALEEADRNKVTEEHQKFIQKSM